MTRRGTSQKIIIIVLGSATFLCPQHTDAGKLFSSVVQLEQTTVGDYEGNVLPHCSLKLAVLSAQAIGRCHVAKRFLRRH